MSPSQIRVIGYPHSTLKKNRFTRIKDKTPLELSEHVLSTQHSIGCQRTIENNIPIFFYAKKCTNYTNADMALLLTYSENC